MLCDFVKELNKLRKSSVESVDDAESFEKVKEYLHVNRIIEHDLKNLLDQIRRNGKKTLLLICGSAGDGKSHLISYLKNVDNAHLLDGFKIHNDAAESDRKDRTAIQTLNDVLSGFKDDALEMPGENLILAINLGILNNFIESEEGKSFTKLADFVRDKDILTGQIGDNSYDSITHFQYISFGDYNLFSLSENGIKTEYLDRLIAKICAKTEDNPFYKMYCNKSGNCPDCSKCPVRHNFEFLSDPAVQSNISKIICEVMVKDKNVISTREVLDFIYDILVHHAFDYNDLNEATESKYLDTYIQYSLPMLIYEYSDRSPMINGIIKYDVLKERSEPLDDFAIQFNVTDDVTPIIKEILDSTSYSNVLLTPNLNQIVCGKKGIKSGLFKMITRLQRLKKPHAFDPDPVYLSYLKNLYWYNKGRKAKLSDLYQIVSQCIFEWNGRLDDDHICINNLYNPIAIFEELDIEPYLDNMPISKLDDLDKFSPCITTSFRKQNVDSAVVSLDIDYSLFKLLKDVNNGYRPTAEDRNKHADFIAFIDSLILLGNASREITLVDNRQKDGKKGVFKKTAFGYEFKVI